MFKNLTYGQREQIRDAYKKWTPKSYPYKYFYEISDYMSPPERCMWNTIRCTGLPFYFQFPVLEYFLDFADPILKIGIEIDGEQWHLDKEKDLKRQKEIENEGWTIYRFPGKFTRYEIFDSEGKQEGCKTDWQIENETIEGLSSYRNSVMNIIEKYHEVHSEDRP